MGNWQIIVPEAETNLITNPSIELATTGFTAIGGSINQSSTYTRRGAYSLAITPSADINSGVYYGTISLTSGTTYTISVDVRGVLGIPYMIYFATTGGVLKGTATEFIGTGDWQRVYVTWTCDSTTTYRLYLTKNNSASTGILYADGFQCSAVSYETTYIDGDRKGLYKWNGTIHASTSTRDAQERSGGRIYDLDDLNITINLESGIGMPSVSHYVQSRSFFPGATYLGQKVNERPINIIFYAQGTSFGNLHSIRKTIIDYIKNDRVKDNQPFILRYVGANSNKPLEISCVYDSGMEWKDINGSEEIIGLRVIAYDPFFYEDGEGSAFLSISVAVGNANYAVKKVNGTWGIISSAFNSIVGSMVNGTDKTIYMGGNFTNVGDGNGDYIIKYNPITNALSSLGTGMDGAVNALAIAPNGDVYAGGAFNSAGGVANTVKIARWNGSAWLPLSTGIGAGTVYTLTVGYDGSLYIGGNFTNVGSASGDYIVKWNGTAFSSLGTGMNGSVYWLDIASNGDLIATGAFTTAGGTTVNGIARWNGNAWAAMGTGVAGGSATGYVVYCAPNGDIYIGGNFTSVNGVSASNIAKYNGITWEALGTGVSGGGVYSLAMKDGLLYVGGNFTSAGGLNLADRMAIWNGSTWSHLDINLPGTPQVYIIHFNGDDLYIGYDTAGIAYSSYLNTITNLGSTEVYPYFSFKPTISGILEWIRNETTDKTLFCNYTILPGEILVIDLDPDERKVESNYFGNVIGRAILRNSDFVDFNLLPGSNDISVFISTTGAFTSYLTYPLTYWSADGVA